MSDLAVPTQGKDVGQWEPHCMSHYSVSPLSDLDGCWNQVHKSDLTYSHATPTYPRIYMHIHTQTRTHVPAYTHTHTHTTHIQHTHNTHNTHTTHTQHTYNTHNTHTHTTHITHTLTVHQTCRASRELHDEMQ